MTIKLLSSLDKVAWPFGLWIMNSRSLLKVLKGFKVHNKHVGQFYWILSEDIEMMLMLKDIIRKMVNTSSPWLCRNFHKAKHMVLIQRLSNQNTRNTLGTLWSKRSYLLGGGRQRYVLVAISWNLLIAFSKASMVLPWITSWTKDSERPSGYLVAGVNEGFSLDVLSILMLGQWSR